MDSLKEKAIKSVVWVGTTKLIGQAFSWLVTLMLIRILSPKDFGAMGMVMAYQSIIIIAYDLSLGEAVIQRKDLSDEDTSTCFWFTIFFGIVLTVVTWIISPVIAGFFRNTQLVWMLRVSSLGILCLSAKEIHTVLLCRNLDFDKRSKAQLASGIISLVVSLAMAVMGYGVWSLVAGLAANHFFHMVFILNAIRWKPKYYFSAARLADLFKFSLPMLGSNFLRYLFNNGDSVIIGRQLGADALGYYRVAMDFSRIPIEKFIVILNQVCFPVFSQLQNDTENLRSYFLKVIRYISIFSFPMFIGMFLLSKDIIDLVLTSKWLPALTLLKIFCIVSIFQSFTGICMVLLKAKGMVWVVFRFSLMSSILLPLSFIFAVPFGIDFVAYCWLFIYPILLLYLLHQVIKTLHITVPLFIRTIFPASAGTAFMTLFVMMARIIKHPAQSPWFLFVISIVIGAGSYLLYFFFFDRHVLKEFLELFRIAVPSKKPFLKKAGEV